VKIIGITGISGSGKTEITRILAKIGGFTIEADPMAHELMKKGQPAYNEIVEAFGQDILDEGGEIHRPSLGKLVFGNSCRLSSLEAIIHPKVAAKTAALLCQAQKSGKHPFAVIDAPLLIEAGMHNMCHSCWLVTADYETRLARIIKRDNISQEAAEKRLASRPGDEALMPYTDIVIENNGDDLADLRGKVVAALESVLRL